MRQAPSSPVALPSVTGRLPPWPGDEVPTRAGAVFVRHTPFAGPPDHPPDDGGAIEARPERALYVHGLGGASTNWTDLAALLAVRVEGHALDLPGFGRSAPSARAVYSIEGHVAAVVDVLEWVVARDDPAGERPAARRPVHLVGNSLGGLVCLLVAVRRPELVATLTLISPAMPVYRVPPAFQRAILLVLLPCVPALAGRRLGRVSAEQRVRGMLTMCFGDPRRVPEERVREAVAEAREHDALPWSGVALTKSLRGLMTSYLRVGRAGAWRAAASLRMPTLVLWGDRDRLVDPAMAPRLAAAVPDSRLLVAEGIGHVAMMEAPELTARAVLALMEDAVVGERSVPVRPRRSGPGRLLGRM